MQLFGPIGIGTFALQFLRMLFGIGTCTLDVLVILLVIIKRLINNELSNRLLVINGACGSWLEAQGLWLTAKGAGQGLGPGGAPGPGPAQGGRPQAPGLGRPPLAMSHEPGALHHEP